MILIPRTSTFLVIILIIIDIQTTIEHRLDINHDNKDVLQFVRSENPFRPAAPKLNDLQRRDYLLNNDLDEIYTKVDSNVMYQTPRGDTDHRGHGQHNRNNQRGRNRERNREANKNPNSIKYNNTFMVNQSGGAAGADLLHDYNAFRADKILKSSKNALIVTKKEYLKKDWCKTEPLVQKIREDGCLSKTIINRFCYGQCNSFYIPKNPKRNKRNHNANNIRQNNEQFEDEDLTGAAFRSCAFCKPKKFAWITITLRCPSMMPQLRKKRIQRVKQCKCIAEPLN